MHCSTKPHFLSFSHVLLSSCVRCIHPSLSLSVSLSFSIIVSVCPTLSVWLPKKHLMCVLMCFLGLLSRPAIAASFSLQRFCSSSDFPTVLCRLRCSCQLLFLSSRLLSCCLSLCACCSPQSSSPLDTAAERGAERGRKVEVPPQSYFLPT